MKRMIAAVLVTVGLAGSAAPLQAASIWTRQFGTAEADEAASIAFDAAGNAYVAGWTAGTLPGQASSGTVDAFLVKFDPMGNRAWSRQFGSWERDFARAVATDAAGNAYVVGETHGALPDQAGAGSFDAFVRKYDAAGKELWTRQFGGGGGEGAWGSAVDKGGNVYVAGTTRGALAGQTSAGGFDAFVTKYDGDGNLLWSRQFGGEAGDGARSAAVDAAGNVLVAGSTDGALPNQAPAGGFDAYVRQYDSGGDHVWTRQFGSEADDYGVAVAVDSGGRVLVVGSADRALPGQVWAGGTDAFVRSFDIDGGALWTEQFGTTASDEAWGVAVDAAGAAYVVGSATGLYVRKWNASGGEVWTQRPGSEGSDLGLSIAVDPEGHSAVAGSTFGSLSGQKSSGARDAFTVKL
jgi:hypothetical protein